MLFYEPSFVTLFAAFCALYLLATASITKKSALLIASVLFYLWGEPVFVLVLLLPKPYLSSDLARMIRTALAS